MPDPVRRIVVAAEQELYGLRAVMGIRRYAAEVRRWDVVDWRSNDGRVLPIVARCKPDGMLIRRPEPAVVAELQYAGIPVVALSVEAQNPCPAVGVDDLAVGRMAADYLISCGFRNFAFCGHNFWHWSSQREGAFCAAIQEAGFGVQTLRTIFEFEQVWSRPDELTQFIAGLSKPVAVLAAHDSLGIRLIEACHTLNLNVPEDVAVLSVDNHTVYCDWTRPELSSIDTAPERIGYEAAALLDRILDGCNPPDAALLIPPARVAVRQSTDVLALRDPEVAAAVRFIRQNSHRALQVVEVVDQTKLSRKALEVRFRKILGHTPMEEIERSQVDRAKVLLLSTDLRISEIALRCGCPFTPRLNLLFRRVTGMSPSQFRARYKGFTADAAEQGAAGVRGNGSAAVVTQGQ